MANNAKNRIPLDEEITRKDINSLLSTPSPWINYGGSMPQANDPNRLFDIFMVMRSGRASTHEISMLQGFAYRQAAYYLDALKYLGLARKVEPGVFELTGKGKEISLMPSSKACLAFAKEMLSHRVFMETFKKCIKDEAIPAIDDVIQIMRRCRIPNDSRVTERRRAASIRDWIIWIVSLPCDIPILNLS